MTINVTMSKEEFLDYCAYKDFKSSIKCGIIDLKDNVNELVKLLLDDGLWQDKNKYDKRVQKIFDNLSVLERGVQDVDSEMSSKSIQ